VNRKSNSENLFLAYINSAKRRETVRLVLLFIGILMAFAIAITALGSYTGLVRGFSPAITNSTRLLMAIVAAVIFIWLLWVPLSKLYADKGAKFIETADAAFNGRVQTFLDTRETTPGHQFLPLLAQDGLSVAKRVPLFRIVPMSAILWSIVLIASLLFFTVGFFQRAPEPWRNAAQHIWMGWSTPGLVVARSIDVEPGNMELLSGENLALNAQINGFKSQTVTLHVRAAGQEWQSSEIAAEDTGFDYTLFRVVEPMEYYFSAAYTQSERYEISVVEPARLQSIEATITYPEWTKLSVETIKDVGRISAVKGSEVVMTFKTDRPLQEAYLSYGDQQLSLEQNELEYSVRFPISKDSQYQLFDRMLDRSVPISAEHAVVIQGDEPPEIRFELPGRDVTASPVEEVLVRVFARDDFSVESVELLYSINAGRRWWRRWRWSIR